MSYFGIFSMDFEETIITFQINTFQFVKMLDFMFKKCKTEKTLFGPYLG